MAAGAVEVRHVLAGHEAEDRRGAGGRRDVVGAGGDHEQVLLDVYESFRRENAAGTPEQATTKTTTTKTTIDTTEESA